LRSTPQGHAVSRLTFTLTSKGHHMAQIHGTQGKDELIGTSSNDVILAYWGDDRISGQAGNDTLLGVDGNDIISGDAGNDLIYGGPGADQLWGGPVANNGFDTFNFTFDRSSSRTDSQAINGFEDVIFDWYAPEDSIRFAVSGGNSVAGSAWNYAEQEADGIRNVSDAAKFANTYHPNKTYVYVWEENFHVSYLVADLNRDHVFETGISILHYASSGSAATMNWSDIIT
jgi:Ca2+-binding RTX toxin-like protein